MFAVRKFTKINVINRQKELSQQKKKELYNSSLLWWDQRDSNPRPRDYESPALPLSYSPKLLATVHNISSKTSKIKPVIYGCERSGGEVAESCFLFLLNDYQISIINFFKRKPVFYYINDFPPEPFDSSSAFFNFFRYFF